MRKKPGPAPTGKGQPVLVRLQPRDLAALDAYAASSDEHQTRPQAMRAIMVDWLTGQGYFKHRDDPEGANGQHG